MRAVAILALAVTAMLALPLSAYAAAKPSTAATDTFKLDFTLPTYGKSGCTVCHSDPNLVRVSGDTTQSIYIDPVLMAEGTHKDILCTGCHIDFAYKTPHENVANGEAWRDVAKSSCRTCHVEQDALTNKSAHSPAVQPGEASPATGTVDVPMCGDCHGSHAILSSAEMTASAAFHSSGIQMCGQCHEEYTDNYRDYYHGAAYQAGAPDAPACWQCHTAHGPLPTESRKSTVNPDNIAETCGQPDCHAEVDDALLEYTPLVHYKQEVKDTIPLYDLYEQARSVFDSAVGTVTGWFGA